jgi:hypothetical protein
MCVIVAKPANVALPPRAELQNCFERNPDGAGLMYPTAEGKVIITKGFPTWAEFERHLSTVEQLVDTAVVPMVLHFRIGTHGHRTAPTHTHPFPICGSYERMMELNTVCDAGMAHNGIIHFGSIGGARAVVDTAIEPSDSMEFANIVLSTLSRVPGWLDEGSPCTAIVEGALGQGNKLAILSGASVLMLYGHFVEHNGCWFSNTTYEERPVYEAPVRKDWNSWSGKNWRDNELFPVKEKVARKSTPFAVELEDYLDEFRVTVQDREQIYNMLFDKRDRTLKAIYMPITVKVVTAQLKDETFELFDPLDAWYLDEKREMLHRFNEKTEIMELMGRIRSVSWKPSLRKVINVEDRDFRLSDKYVMEYS